MSNTIFQGLANFFSGETMSPAPFLVTGLIIGNDFLFFISLHCPQLFSATPCPTDVPTFLDVVEMHNWVHRRCKGNGRHSKWRCCAHKASHTRYCEYPMCHKPWSIGGQEGRKWIRKLPNITDVIKIVNAILNSPKKVVSLMNLSQKWEAMGIFFIILKCGGSLVKE